ncbi:MAG: alkaline phosphatase D family protein, partial [Solirubrobacterales bacterium]
LSGDVHHAYLAEVEFPGDGEVTSAVYQAVCSPFRNPLDARERRTIKANFTRPAARIARALARAARVPAPEIDWRLCEGPYFDNQVGTLTLEDRSSTFRLEKTVADEAGRDRRPKLEQVFEHRLA